MTYPDLDRLATDFTNIVCYAAYATFGGKREIRRNKPYNAVITLSAAQQVIYGRTTLRLELTLQGSTLHILERQSGITGEISLRPSDRKTLQVTIPWILNTSIQKRTTFPREYFMELAE